MKISELLESMSNDRLRGYSGNFARGQVVAKKDGSAARWAIVGDDGARYVLSPVVDNKLDIRPDREVDVTSSQLATDYRVVGQFRFVNTPQEIKEYSNINSGSGDGNNGGNVYNAVLYNKSTGEIAHENFIDTNEDNARDRIKIVYRDWKLVALWRDGDPPISTRTADKTSWFVEYQDDDKKKIRLLSLSGGITTEQKAREYLATYYPSWRITMLRRMK